MSTKAMAIEIDMNRLEDVLRRAEAKLHDEDYAL